MPKLLLVKHALPEIAPDVPAKRWRLGEKGRAQSFQLAEALRPHHPGIVITSDEPKAEETGQIVAAMLELPHHTAPDLHEQDNTGSPYFDHPGEFEETVRALFVEPDRRAYGNESADEARRRFTEAVKRALEPHLDQNVVLIAHGRINTLFVAAHNPVEPFEFWKDWQLATFVVLSRPESRLLGPRLTVEP